MYRECYRVNSEHALSRSAHCVVTCGSTAGPSVQFNLMQLFQQQYKIFGSFGATMQNIRESLDKMAGGMHPVIDMEVPLEQFEKGLERLETRKVVDRAKGLLMDGHGLSESEAFSWIQKRAMQDRRTMRAVADEVIAGDLAPEG